MTHDFDHLVAWSKAAHRDALGNTASFVLFVTTRPGSQPDAYFQSRAELEGELFEGPLEIG